MNRHFIIVKDLYDKNIMGVIEIVGDYSGDELSEFANRIQRIANETKIKFEDYTEQDFIVALNEQLPGDITYHQTMNESFTVWF